MNEREAREAVERLKRAPRSDPVPEPHTEMTIVLDRELRRGIAAQLRALAAVLEMPEIGRE